jgi:hypothetical protein
MRLYDDTNNGIRGYTDPLVLFLRLCYAGYEPAWGVVKMLVHLLSTGVVGSAGMLSEGTGLSAVPAGTRSSNVP